MFRRCSGCGSKMSRTHVWDKQGESIVKRGWKCEGCGV